MNIGVISLYESLMEEYSVCVYEEQ